MSYSVAEDSALQATTGYRPRQGVADAAEIWSLPALDALARAAAVVARSMPPTPQYSWPLLNARACVEVWVKHENHTPVGAFKIRGALVYMDWLIREHPEVRGVICATRGNFGQAVSYAAHRNGLSATIVVPCGNSPDQNRAIRAHGAELIEHGDDYQAANEHAARLEVEHGYHRIPSFHELLVHGTGTYALEFLRGAPEMDTVYVPIGQGSSVCGMMAVRDALSLKTRIVGVVSSAAPAYALSFEQRRLVESSVTTVIADGLACRKPVAKSLEFIFHGVERIVAVTDEEVRGAMLALYEDTHQVAEGAGAASLAALLQDQSSGCLANIKRAGVVLTGSNVNRKIFADILRAQQQ
ncbi:MAG TPA: threonine dehydratase [Acidisarcina sp.]